VRADLDDGQEDQEAFLNTLTAQEVEELKVMVNSDNIYQRLVSSIAPTVYGGFSSDALDINADNRSRNCEEGNLAAAHGRSAQADARGYPPSRRY
jgi:hypothetical protein